MSRNIGILATVIAVLLSIAACDADPNIETKEQAIAYAKAYMLRKCPDYPLKDVHRSQGFPLKMYAIYAEDGYNLPRRISHYWIVGIEDEGSRTGMGTQLFRVYKGGILQEKALLHGCARLRMETG